MSSQASLTPRRYRWGSPSSGTRHRSRPIKHSCTQCLGRGYFNYRRGQNV